MGVTYAELHHHRLRLNGRSGQRNRLSWRATGRPSLPDDDRQQLCGGAIQLGGHRRLSELVRVGLARLAG